jgi:hypothetical protein
METLTPNPDPTTLNPQSAAVMVDPMCGSGTLLIEAALIARGKAPGLSRPVWPFFSWPDFSPQLWRECVAVAREAEKATPGFDGKLLGNDAHEGSLLLAQRCACLPWAAALVNARSVGRNTFPGFCIVCQASEIDSQRNLDLHSLQIPPPRRSHSLLALQSLNWNTATAALCWHVLSRC